MAQVNSFDITALGSNGDTITVTITPVNPSGNNEVIQYTKSSSEDTLLKMAQAVADLINNQSELVRAVACGTGTVVISARFKGDSFSVTAVASGSITVSNVTELVANTRGKGLHFESPQGISNGTLEKASDTWKGTVASSGTASYFRIKAYDDTGGSDSTKLRIQGTVGTLADSPLHLSGSSTLTAGTTVTIGAFSIRVPMTNGLKDIIWK